MNFGNQIATFFKVFKYLVAAKVLTDFEVTSVYRDLPLNQCAGGVKLVHATYSILPSIFELGPENPNLKIMLILKIQNIVYANFGTNMSQSLNMGLVYTSGQIHIDTQDIVHGAQTSVAILRCVVTSFFKKRGQYDPFLSIDFNKIWSEKLHSENKV